MADTYFLSPIGTSKPAAAGEAFKDLNSNNLSRKHEFDNIGIVYDFHHAHERWIDSPSARSDTALFALSISMVPI